LDVSMSQLYSIWNKHILPTYTARITSYISKYVNQNLLLHELEVISTICLGLWLIDNDV
jgi:hypothetical protein